MRIIGRKTIIYSLVGLLQVGMFSSVAAAFAHIPDNNGWQQVVQLHSHDRHGDDARQRAHDEKLRRERERHEREMERRHYESEREWRERQRHEDDRHDRELRDIAALLIGIAIGSGSADND